MVLETQVILLHVGAIDIRHGVFQAELEIIAKWIPPSEVCSVSICNLPFKNSMGFFKIYFQYFKMKILFIFRYE